MELMALLKRNKIWLVFVSIIIISTAMHWKVFKLDLISIHVWRQTETQSTINNFYNEDYNILNPRRNNRGDTEGYFRMEFPLMQWLFASAAKIFGNSVLLTRILTFIIGFITLFGLYMLVKTISNNHETGLLAAWCMNFSPSFYYYTVNPLPDNFALAFAVWGMAFFFLSIRLKKNTFFLLSVVSS
jgi:hypothetical protein